MDIHSMNAKKKTVPAVRKQAPVTEEYMQIGAIL